MHSGLRRNETEWKRNNWWMKRAFFSLARQRSLSMDFHSFYSKVFSPFSGRFFRDPKKIVRVDYAHNLFPKGRILHPRVVDNVSVLSSVMIALTGFVVFSVLFFFFIVSCRRETKGLKTMKKSCRPVFRVKCRVLLRRTSGSVGPLNLSHRGNNE